MESFFILIDQTRIKSEQLTGMIKKDYFSRPSSLARATAWVRLFTAIFS